MRFGLLGTGYWAAEVHAAGLAQDPRVEFVGVWGRDPAKAEALAQRYQVRAYDEPEALFDDVDAVAVALPPDIQAALATQAAKLGKHLLLDKPVALDLTAADRLVEAVESGGVSSVVFFTARFTPAVSAFLAQAVATGGWEGARCAHLTTIDPSGPFGGSPWRKEKGGLWDVGPHALAKILPVLGPVAGVAAVEGPHQTTYLTLTHRSGAVSVSALSVHVPEPAAIHETVFHGTGGLATVPEHDVDGVTAFGTAVDQLLAVVAGGGRHPCDVRFGRDVVAVLAAAEAARASGQTVAL